MTDDLGSSAPLRLALFDLDGTLIAGDSLRRFVCLVARRAPRTLGQIPAIVRRLLGSRGRAGPMKEAILGVIDPLSAAEQRALVAELIESLARTCLRPEIVGLVARQEAAGRLPILISASPDLYVVPLAARLGFRVVLATRLLRRDDGGCRSRIAGENLKGRAKLTALLQHLGTTPIDWSGSFACGDRYSDRVLLEQVGEAVAVHPDPRLRAQARVRGWRIVI